MIALDTNLLARLLLQDDKAQHARVKALLASQQMFTAPVTIFLELVWVLEANDCAPAEIQRGLTLLLGVPNFKPVQADIVRAALTHYAQGLDFADALHLALSRAEQALMTFDKAFVRRAAKLAVAPQVTAA
jgi:predicted nucleic-acid-binding protein